VHSQATNYVRVPDFEWGIIYGVCSVRHHIDKTHMQDAHKEE